jgi:hypothetical protein
VKARLNGGPSITIVPVIFAGMLLNWRVRVPVSAKYGSPMMKV